MQVLSKSATKFRQVSAPRTRQGRVSQQLTPKNNGYMSARKNVQANPESVKKIDKKGNNNKFTIDEVLDKKLDLGLYQTQPQSFKNFGKYQSQRLQKKQPQKTIHGRKLQYPHPKPTRYNQEASDPQLKRSQSANQTTSKHFVDRTVKSKQVKEQKQVFQQKFQKAFNYLLKNNSAYLHEHSRICNQRARPKQQIFKINLGKTLSTYTEHYPPKNAPYQLYMEPQNQKTALSLGPRKVCGNSTNNQKHDGKQGPRADLQTWPEGFKLQGPLDGTTTYANKFPNHGDYQKMVPIAKFDEIVTGMPHITNSTHRSHFKGENGNAADLATWDNLHPYGNDFNPDRGTHYSDKHNYKQKQPIQQWPMYDPRLIISDGKFSTQYRAQLSDQYKHELNDTNYCKCGRKKCKKHLIH